MSDGNDGKTRSIPSIVWITIIGGLALIAALGEAFETLPRTMLNENQHWIIEFLPDLLVFLILLAVTPLLLRRIDWRQSLTRVRAQSRGQFAVLCAMAVIGVGVLVPLSGRVRDLYQIRYQRAFLDWHAVRALDRFRTRDYETVTRELKKIAPASIPAIAADLRSDIAQRYKDADHLVRRFRTYSEEGRSPMFAEVLMVGRAVRLAPQAVAVDPALSDARKIVEEALTQYLRGLEKIRQGDVAAAVAELRRSRTTCRDFLHQDLLLRYARNRDMAAYSADEQGLLAYYVHTPGEKLTNDLLAYPPIRQFAPRRAQLPSIP